MALARTNEDPDNIPLRVFSRTIVPGIGEGNLLSSVARPSFLDGDETAFAFYLTDPGLMPIVRPGSLMYGSRLRDPSPGDIVVITMKGSVSLVRVVLSLSEDGFETLHAEEKGGDFIHQKDVIPFEDLEEIAVVVCIRRRTTQ